MHARTLLGRSGEDLAAALYRRRGFRVIDRNYRCPAGEIDLVARRGDLLVFCEVKTRRSSYWGQPSEAVDLRKQARYRRLAASWLRDHRIRRVDIRFDVVSVIVRDGRPEATLIEDAF